MMKRAAWSLVFLAACASGGAPNTGGGDDVTPKLDAAPSTHHDAPVIPPHDATPAIDAPHSIDAFVFHDAPMTTGPDASTMGGFCSDNTDCTTTGECCFVAVCVPGTGIGATLCFPD